MALTMAPYYPGVRPGMMAGPGGMLDPFSMLSMGGPAGIGLYGPGPMSFMSRRGPSPLRIGAMADPMSMALRSGMIRPPLAMPLEYEDLYDLPRRRPRRGLLRRASYGDRGMWDDDFDEWDEMDPEDVLTLLLRRSMRGRGSYRYGRQW